MRSSKLLSLPVVFLLLTSAGADDWPQWLGQNRDSVWREDGIVTQFPDEGLPVQWRAKVGLGYAGPAVAGGRVYLMDYQRETGKLTNNPGARDKLTGKERVLSRSSKGIRTPTQYCTGSGTRSMNLW